jgi:hypothetical protein
MRKANIGAIYFVNILNTTNNRSLAGFIKKEDSIAPLQAIFEVSAAGGQ